MCYLIKSIEFATENEMIEFIDTHDIEIKFNHPTKFGWLLKYKEV
jgi:hypothetical protein